ncbi:MAG TPA: hypothetical protein VEV85_22920 [Bryobacteraceae bacterium]|nr:hypothetical protein [Bryobacteraceae bacterium]
MIQSLAAILGAALTSGACYAAGVLLIGKLGVKLHRAERVPLAFILGAACLHLAVFAILALHIAYWPVFLLLLVGMIATTLWRAGFSPREASASQPESSAKTPRGLKPALLILFGAFTVLYFFHALAPESSPDGSTYHLGFVARYLRARGFVRVEDMYAALSGGVEMVFTPAFAVGKHSAAALTHFAFLIALALAVFAYGQRLGKPWAGAAAAFLVYASPVVGIDGTSAYIDVAVAAVVFAVFYWLEIWDELRDDGLLIPAGLLAGYAYAAKYTAFVMFFYAAGFVVWRSRSFRPLLRLSACSLLMAGPWMLRNWVLFQNPVAPFAGELFHDSHFHVITIRQWASYLRRYEVANLWSLPLEVTVRGLKTAGVIGPVFLLIPVFLLSMRFRAGRRLLAAGLILLTTYLANVGTRFLIPELPFFALALTLAPGDSPGLVACLVIFHAITALPSGVEVYAMPGLWRLPHRVLYREALRIVPQDRYLREQSLTYDLARLVEEHVPKGERVLDLAGVAHAYTSREMLGDYYSAFNDDLKDMLNTGWYASYQPRVLEQIQFPENTVSRIRIEQSRTASPGEQWSVHELRFFYRGKELTRRPEWRLSARPNSWDVQFAFDNSPATRWRTWERAASGDYVQVDFGRPEAVDEARIETSYDHNLQGKVKLWDQALGRWIEADGEHRTGVLKPDANIRRYATREIALRGVRYLLIPDEFQGSFDFRGDPEAWGLELAAQGYGARLYHIVP